MSVIFVRLNHWKVPAFICNPSTSAGGTPRHSRMIRDAVETREITGLSDRLSFCCSHEEKSIVLLEAERSTRSIMRWSKLTRFPVSQLHPRHKGWDTAELPATPVHLEVLLQFREAVKYTATAK